MLKLTLSTIAEHPKRGALEAAIPPDLLVTINDARPSEWLPVSVTARMLETVYAVLGPEDFVAFYVRQIERAQFDSAFGRFISGVTGIFARTPLARLQYLPRGFDLAQRECGVLDIDADGPHGATILAHSMPRELRTEIYAISLRAPFKFAVMTAGHDIEAIEVTPRLEVGEIRYRLQWTAEPRAKHSTKD